MILIQLDEATHDELKALRRHELLPRVRDRFDMVLLSSVTWSPARVATHLGYCAATVRGLLKDFLDRGSAALFPRLTGPLAAPTGDTCADRLARSGAYLDQQATGHCLRRAGHPTQLGRFAATSR